LEKVKPVLIFKKALLPLLVFIGAFGVFLATPMSSQVYSDPRWSIQLAYSIIHEGNINLDEYKAIIHPEDYSVRNLDGHQYSLYPMGAPILAIPFVFVYDLLTPNTSERINDVHPKAQEFIASFIVALTAVLLYLIASLSLNPKQSLLVAFIFALCTSAWSTATRALWQHGPSMFCLSLALYILLLAKKRSQLAQYASIPLALSFVIRPLNAFSILLFSLYVLIYYRKYFFKYLLWSLVIALPFFLMNYATFGSFLPEYYHKYGEFVAPTVERIFGPLVSPGRGLFVYSPVFLFSLLGIFLKLKGFQFKNPEKVLDLVLVIIIVIHCFTISIWMMWWGGYSTGPRMLSDIIPYLVYLLIPVIQYLSSPTGFLHPLRLGFIVTLLISFLMTAHTATSDAVYTWNSVPNSVDQNLPRLWNWNDPPFLRGLSWIDKVFPNRLKVEPSEIMLKCKPNADKTDCSTTITIATFPRQEFNWKIVTPAGLSANPAKGENLYQRSTITLSFGKSGFSPGTYNIGNVKILAVQKSGTTLNTLVTVPVTLEVIP
jgi:hypothetical protein